MASRSSSPIERKVTAATGGSAAGVSLAGLILWLLDEFVFRSGPIPDALTVAVMTLLPIGLTFAAGYLARHTPRPGLEGGEPLSNVYRRVKPDRLDLEQRLTDD